MQRKDTDYGNALIFGTPLPPQDDLEVPMPIGFYVCMACKQVTNYWEPGMVCQKCELDGEEQMEMARGN